MGDGNHVFKNYSIVGLRLIRSGSQFFDREISGGGRVHISFETKLPADGDLNQGDRVFGVGIAAVVVGIPSQSNEPLFEVSCEVSAIYKARGRGGYSASEIIENSVALSLPAYYMVREHLMDTLSRMGLSNVQVPITPPGSLGDEEEEREGSAPAKRRSASTKKSVKKRVSKKA